MKHEHKLVVTKPLGFDSMEQAQAAIAEFKQAYVTIECEHTRAAIKWHVFGNETLTPEAFEKARAFGVADVTGNPKWLGCFDEACARKERGE